MSSFLEDVYDDAHEQLNTLQSKGLNSFSSLKSLDERYSHFQEVNRGGLKKIISAHDDVTDRLVAIAFLKDPHSLMEPAFVHEARLNAKLQHPNIIPVYDIGHDEQEGPFFTMKLIEGQSLGQILLSLRKRHHKTVAAYPLVEMVEIFKKICDAVSYAHTCGVIHLDLKPDNIQIGCFGEVLVCDWGMAKVLDEECSEEFISNKSEALVNVTLNGEIKGTPGYMAPEQIKERRKDQRTDIYGLGSILYSLLTWHLPIEGRDLDTVLRNTVKGKFQSPRRRSPSREIPESLNAVVMKCMEKSPSRRYQNVDEIIKEVDLYSRGFSTAAQDAGFKKQLLLLYRRNAKICLMAFTSLLLLTAIVIYFVSNLNEQRNAALSAQGQAEKSEEKAKESETAAKEIAAALQKEKEKKVLLSKHTVNDTLNRMAKTWQSGDHLNLEQVKEMINSCFALDPGNKQALYNLAHISIIELNFPKAFQLYTKGAGRDDEMMAAFCKEKVQYLNGRTELSVEEKIQLSRSLISLNKTSVHRILSRKVLSETALFKDSLKLAEGYFHIDNRHLKKVSLVNNYENGILSLRNLKGVNFRIVSLLEVDGLNLSGSEIKLYPYRKQLIHYRYLNLKGSNIKGLPFSSKNLTELHLSSVTKDLRFLKNCPVLETLYIPKGQFKIADIQKLTSARIVAY